jgi:hypothetical protein
MNNVAAALTRRSFDLPADIPAPKFQLFQRVRYENQIHTITGMEYIDPATALRRNLEYEYFDEDEPLAWEVGWEYIMSLVHGAPLEAITINGALTIVADEDELELVEVES